MKIQNKTTGILEKQCGFAQTNLLLNKTVYYLAKVTNVSVAVARKLKKTHIKQRNWQLENVFLLGNEKNTNKTKPN